MSATSAPLVLPEGFFQGLPPADLTDIASLLHRRRYRKGEAIFREGDPGSTLYIIESGEIKVVLASRQGKEIILTILGPGGLLGEMALLDNEPRSADAVARVESWLYMLQREPFLEFLYTHPVAAVSVIRSLSRRLRRTTGLLQDAAFLNVPQRLAHLLLELHEARERGPDGVLVSPRLTQSELAELVGTTRETLNKWLGFYERQGLVHRQKGLVQVLKPDDLRQRIY